MFDDPCTPQNVTLQRMSRSKECHETNLSYRIFLEIPPSAEQHLIAALAGIRVRGAEGMKGIRFGRGWKRRLCGRRWIGLFRIFGRQATLCGRRWFRFGRFGHNLVFLFTDGEIIQRAKCDDISNELVACWAPFTSCVRELPFSCPDLYNNYEQELPAGEDSHGRFALLVSTGM